MPKLDGLSLAVVYEGGRLARAITRGDGTTGDDVTCSCARWPTASRTGSTPTARVEVRGELVMLRSTFAAYNAAHPDKPLINPRNAAAGRSGPRTRRRSRAATCASSRSTSTPRTAPHADLEEALRDLGFDAADMRHCDDAEAAQAVIAAIEASRNELDYDLDGAVLRLADRNAYAAAGTRSNSPRGALAFKFAAEEKTTRARRRGVGRRQDRQGRAGGGARAGVRRRHDGHARDARQPGGDPRARRADRRHRAGAPRGRRDPVRGRRARRVQAHRRRARDRAARPSARRAGSR